MKRNWDTLEELATPIYPPERKMSEPTQTVIAQIRGEQIILLRDELQRAVEWMKRCAEHEKSKGRKAGYRIRIDAAERLLK